MKLLATEKAAFSLTMTVTWKAFGCSSALHICKAYPKERGPSQTWCRCSSRRAFKLKKNKQNKTPESENKLSLSLLKPIFFSVPLSPASDPLPVNSSQRCTSFPPVDWTSCKPGCNQYAFSHLERTAQRNHLDSFPVGTMFHLWVLFKCRDA